MISCLIVRLNVIYIRFSNEIGGGGNELSLRFIVLLLHRHSCVFTVQ